MTREKNTKSKVTEKTKKNNVESNASTHTDNGSEKLENKKIHNKMSAQKTKKKIGLALQGGGAHGSFAWGIIDKLLETDEFEILGVSGTSAGGMNAACVVQGIAGGKSQDARDLLNRYWSSMSKLSSDLSFSDYNMFDKMDNNPNLRDRFSNKIKDFFFSYAVHHATPYEFNPLNMNPFKDFLSDFFDYDVIRQQDKIKLFLAATHVKTGKIKIFNNHDVSADVLMATACLPELFQAVEIDGEHYWDGGFIANPAIYPIINECDTQDIFIVQLRRSNIDYIPKTREEISDRFKEITFNGCLLREMRAIHFITQLIDQGIIQDPSMKRLNMHVIQNDSAFDGLNMSSALNTDWEFISRLFNAGRQTAENWMNKNFDNVNKTLKIDPSLDNTFSTFV
ncbi:MAG: patatin [Candidatus Puniceispirillum sp.]|nr:patatin [Candidatus Pelagibacter sp.]MBA4283328.1 patatin [Candidatus Puniceispirillum sp.]